MLENIIKHCQRWLGIAGLTLSFQACDHPPSMGISRYSDSGVVTYADASLEKDGPQADENKGDTFLGLPDAGSDGAIPDIPSDAGDYDAQLPDATTTDGIITYDTLPPDSSVGKDVSIADVSLVDSGYNAVDAAPDATIDGMYLPDASLSDVLNDGNEINDASPDATVDGPLNNPPVLYSIGNYVVNEGESLEFIVSAGDPDNDPLIFGAGNLPPGSSFNAADQLFSWTPNYEQAGEYNVTFIVSDGQLFDYQTINIAVVDAPSPDAGMPDAEVPDGSVGNQYDGAVLDVALSDVLHDAENPDAMPPDALPFDGALDAADESDGSIDALINHPPVLCPIGNKEMNEKELLQFLVCASDPDGDTLIYGAGNLPLGSTFDISNQLFRWIPTYSQAGQYQTTFLVSDGELSDIETIDITVFNVPCEKYSWEDADGDGFGNPESSWYSCEIPDGYVENDGDCDDTDPLINPLAVEDCDGLDNDCNNLSDDNLTVPSRDCSVGDGACTGYGLEYKVCLGTNGWSEEYFNCDAVEGEPSEEICDGIDNDCNGLSDDGDIAIIDDFNRPDQNGLGWNAFGEWWAEYGTCDDWDIVNDAAETFWIGLPCYNPNTHSEIGHHDTFNILTKFRFFNTNGSSGNGVLVLNINASGGQNGSGDGLAARIAVNNYSTHALVREGIDLAFGSTALADNIDYLLRFSYDGSQLQLKIWEEGTTEPALPLISAAADDVSPARSYMTITGDMDMNEQAGVSIDYIVNGECDYDHDTIPDAEDNCPLVPNSGLKDTLLEGEWKEYQVNGTTYGVTLSFVDSDEAKFNVNGEPTPKLKRNQSYTLTDTSKVIVRDVLYQDYAGGIHSATFRVGAQKDSDGDGVGDACDTTPVGMPEPEEE